MRYKLSLNGCVQNVINSFICHYTPVSLNTNPWVTSQQLRFAKRRGYRIAAAQKAKKLAVDKKPVGPKIFVPKRGTDEKGDIFSKRYYVDGWLKTPPMDDVFQARFYKCVQFSTMDLIELFRQLHHPSVYDNPNALLHITVELDMRLKKTNKYLDNVTAMLQYPHMYDNAFTNRVLAIAQTEAERSEALNNGATMAGHKDVITQIKKGEITTDDFDYVIANMNCIQDMIPIKNIMKNKFPTIKHGTAGANLSEMAKKFSTGISAKFNRDNFEADFGWVDLICGQLSMTNEQIYENIQYILTRIHSYKPNQTEWPFITRVTVTSPPAEEKLDLLFTKHIAPEENAKLEKIQAKEKMTADVSM